MLVYSLLIIASVQIQNIPTFSDSSLNVSFFPVSLFLLPPLPTPYPGANIDLVYITTY